MSPIDQLRDYFLRGGVGDEYAQQVIEFTKEAVDIYNESFRSDYGDTEGIMIPCLLLYNVNEKAYEKRILALDESVGSKEDLIFAIAKTMIGMQHPLYTVAYCISADGWVSHCHKDDEGLMDELGEDDPLKQPMVIHSLHTIMDVSKTIVYLIKEEDGKVRLELFKEIGVDSKVRGNFANIFDRAANMCDSMESTGIKLYKDNIFDNETK